MVRDRKFKMLVYAVNLCMTKPGTKVMFIGKDRQKMTVEMAQPMFGILQLDPRIRKVYRISNNASIEMANGSKIRFVVCKNENDKHRFEGRTADLICVDSGLVYETDGWDPRDVKSELRRRIRINEDEPGCVCYEDGTLMDGDGRAIWEEGDG